eukprot:gene23145-30349_t
MTTVLIVQTPHGRPQQLEPQQLEPQQPEPRRQQPQQKPARVTVATLALHRQVPISGFMQTHVPVQQQQEEEVVVVEMPNDAFGPARVAVPLASRVATPRAIIARAAEEATKAPAPAPPTPTPAPTPTPTPSTPSTPAAETPDVEFDSKQMEDLSAQAFESLDKALKPIQAEWDAAPESERPAAIGIILFAILAQIAIGSTMDVVDKIPVVNSALEFIGIVVSGAYAYRYFTEPTERTAVTANIDSFVKSVKG